MKNLIICFTLLLICNTSIAQKGVSGGISKPIEVMSPSWYGSLSADSMNLFIESFIKMSGKPYTVWSRDTSTLSEKAKKIVVRLSEPAKNQLQFVFLERKIGADLNLGIAGDTRYDFAQLKATFKDIFQWWQYSVDPSADLVLTSKKTELKKVLRNYGQENIDQEYLKIEDDGGGNWKLYKW